MFCANSRESSHCLSLPREVIETWNPARGSHVQHEPRISTNLRVYCTVSGCDLRGRGALSIPAAESNCVKCTKWLATGSQVGSTSHVPTCGMKGILARARMQHRSGTPVTSFGVMFESSTCAVVPAAQRTYVKHSKHYRHHMVHICVLYSR